MDQSKALTHLLMQLRQLLQVSTLQINSEEIKYMSKKM